jgi:hypothetical protein
MLTDVVDKHAPIKHRYPRRQSAPYINSNLRKAIYKKKMLNNKFLKYRNNTNWEAFRKQRNLVTKIKRSSIKVYCYERCAGGPKSKDFWSTIKPFLSKGTTSNANTIILQEGNNMVTDQTEVAEIFNDYYVNVAKYIGKGDITDLSTHPSVLAITEKHPLAEDNPFSFRHATEQETAMFLDKIGKNKATGTDGLPSKLLKIAKPAIVTPITNIVNKMIDGSTFPSKLKEARLTPVLKKNDILDKQNFRPVSILQVISKIFERAINHQLGNYFETIFNPLLSAFREGYGCQSVLLKITEEWRKALDDNKYVASILMDLSKAFDCLPHDLLLYKLKVYGLSESAVDLVWDSGSHII